MGRDSMLRPASCMSVRGDRAPVSSALSSEAPRAYVVVLLGVLGVLLVQAAHGRAPWRGGGGAWHAQVGQTKHACSLCSTKRNTAGDDYAGKPV